MNQQTLQVLQGGLNCSLSTDENLNANKHVQLPMKQIYTVN